MLGLDKIPTWSIVSGLIASDGSAAMRTDDCVITLVIEDNINALCSSVIVIVSFRLYR
jgi:hypothetical protein